MVLLSVITCIWFPLEAEFCKYSLDRCSVDFHFNVQYNQNMQQTDYKFNITKMIIRLWLRNTKIRGCTTIIELHISYTVVSIICKMQNRRSTKQPVDHLKKAINQLSSS